MSYLTTTSKAKGKHSAPTVGSDVRWDSTRYQHAWSFTNYLVRAREHEGDSGSQQGYSWDYL